MPFGYGPAAKLLTLADRLAADWRLVFVGGGSAHELIARSTSRFDAVHASEGAVPDRLLAEADAALSLMDRRLAEAAVRASLPLAVVDSLLWMRSETPAALKHARLYLAQAFPALGPEAHDPRPVVVGPIVATTPVRGRDAARAGLVLNLGGSAAPDGRHALYVAYARMLLEALHGSGLRERFGRISVLGGRTRGRDRAGRHHHHRRGRLRRRHRADGA
jgi:hypothetical protein